MTRDPPYFLWLAEDVQTAHGGLTRHRSCTVIVLYCVPVGIRQSIT
jgi:hypothetical protein